MIGLHAFVTASVKMLSKPGLAPFSFFKQGSYKCQLLKNERQKCEHWQKVEQ
jgi:hypothetical protein